MNKDIPTPILIIINVLCVLVGAAFGGSMTRDSVYKKAIEKHAAYYHPITGEFTWRELPVMPEVPVEKDTQ